MSKVHITFDFSKYTEFFARLRQAGNGDFRSQLALFLEGMGFEFLRLVQDEIIRRKIIDTRLMLNSFYKGGDGNVWEVEEGGLTLEVGTVVQYAAFVNNGHWTNPKGVETRFVPGDVVLDSSGKIIEFTYNPNAKTGMVLKQKWIEGAHYWESAINIFEKMFPDMLDAKMQDWINEYFKDFV